MMKQFKFILIFIVVVITLNAKHEGMFNVENIDKSGDFFEIDTLTVKYTVDFLMGEMVLDAKAKYSLGNYITVDGTIYRMNEFPDEVKSKLKLTELKVQVGIVSGLALPNMNVSIDLGAMGKPDTWSYNTSSSPNWDKFIYNGIHEVPMYFDKEKTIKVMKEFKRFGLGEHLSDARTVSIGYDISAVREYIINQKKDKAKKAEEKLKEAEEQLKKTKAEKQDTAIEDVAKSKEQVMTTKKDLLAELERKESAEYKRRVEKENRDALDELFAALEEIESKNYNKRVNKIRKDTTVKSKKRIVNTGKSISKGKNSIKLNNTRWKHISHYKELEDDFVTIIDNEIMRKHYYKHKLTGYSKYRIISHPQKNYWIIKGGNYSTYHTTHPPIKYVLFSNGKYLRFLGYKDGNYYVDDYVTDNDFTKTDAYYEITN